MYKSFYNLDTKPFQISTDPAFMWLGEKHKEALATLKYGVIDNKGFLLLTGDVGTGKTTLINSLVSSLSDNVVCASVPDPSLEKIDFFNYIGSAFNIGDSFASKGEFLKSFRTFLHNTYEEKKKALLIIDESQLLTQELLEEIRLLSNIERTDTKLLNIFFIGQNEFNDILNQEQNRAVKQRLTLHYIIEPLTVDETNLYVEHRLRVAGYAGRLFTPLAIREVHTFSGGFPRRINILCDHCLLTGYAAGKTQIDESTVEECANELRIPEKTLPSTLHEYTTVPPVYPSQEVPSSPPELPRQERDTRRPYVKLGLGVAFLAIFFFYGDGILQSIIQKTESFSHNYTETKRQSTTQGITPPYSQSHTDVTEKGIESPEEKKIHMAQPIIATPTQPKKENQRPSREVTDNKISTTKQQAKPVNELLPLPTEPLIIHFTFNSYEFEKQETRKLENFSKIMAMHSKSKIFLRGHSDSDGDENFNVMLSIFRANLVKSYLHGKGIKEEQIQVEGYGSKKPLESNATPWGKRMNRRVEITVLP